MKNQLLLWEYDTNFPENKGNPLSEFVTHGWTTQNVIDGTIPEFQITLLGTDIPYRFTAGKKFIAELQQYEAEAGKEHAVTMDIFHLILKDDFTEDVRMQDYTTTTHRMTFNTPEILAQRITLDDFSVTFRLQDVNLDIPLPFNLETTINSQWNVAGNEWLNNNSRALVWANNRI